MTVDEAPLSTTSAAVQSLGTAPETAGRPHSRRGVRAAVRSLLMWAGGLVLLVIVCAAIAAPLLSLGWGPTEIDFDSNLSAPSPVHIMGTDRNGMDIWARILYGARVDLVVAIVAIGLAVLIGGIIGAASAYAGGWVDEITMRATDIFQAFPSFVLALAVAAVLGPGVRNLVVVVTLVNLPAYVRLMRSEVIATKERAFVEAARCQGLSPMSILFRQVVPNSLNPVLAIAPLNCGWAMLTVAGLSFLGLGIPIPNPEWGSMISTGAGDVVAGQWWTSVFPGLALFLTVLAFNLFGEGLRDVIARK